MLSHSPRTHSSARQLSPSLLPINLGQMVLNKISSRLCPKWPTLSLHLPLPFFLPLELFPSHGHCPYLFLLVMICWGIGNHGKVKGRADFSLLTSLTERTYAYHPCVSSWEDWILHFSQWLGFSPCLPTEVPSSSSDGSSCPPIPDSLDEGEKGRKQTVTFTWFFFADRGHGQHHVSFCVSGFTGLSVLWSVIFTPTMGSDTRYNAGIRLLPPLAFAKSPCPLEMIRMPTVLAFK